MRGTPGCYFCVLAKNEARLQDPLSSVPWFSMQSFFIQLFEVITHDQYIIIPFIIVLYVVSSDLVKALRP